jgi:hypothetical protein
LRALHYAVPSIKDFLHFRKTAVENDWQRAFRTLVDNRNVCICVFLETASVKKTEVGHPFAAECALALIESI